MDIMDVDEDDFSEEELEFEADMVDVPTDMVTFS